MSVTNSPNMSLPVPAVGTESSPDYAIDVNSCLTILDQHTHGPGSGVLITPTAISINAALTFANNFATNVAGVTFTAQGSTPANGTVYESGTDLYFVDGLGNNVQLTANGAVAGTSGSIANLVSPASASYTSVPKTFVWQSDSSIAAHMDFGSAIMRNLSPNSTYALTLSPPAALAANYALTLPALPASQKIMTLDSSGIMSAPYTIDGSSLEISSNVIQIKDLGVSTAKIAAKAVTAAKIADLTITGAQIADGTLSDTQIAAGGISNVSISGMAASKNTGNLTSVTSTVSASVQTPGTTYSAMTGFTGVTATGTQTGRQYLVTISCVTDPGYWSSSPADVVSLRVQDNAGGNVRYYTFDTVGQTPFNFAYVASTNPGVASITIQGFIKTGIAGTAITIPTLAVTVKELL